MANFNLDNFISTVRREGLARTNRFEVQINVPPGLPGGRNLPTNINSTNSRLVSLFAEVSNLPPMNLFVKPFRIYGPSYQRPISSDYGGDGITMTFHIDKNMKVKRFFDDWMETVVDKNSYHVSYQKDYITNIILRQIDEQDNTTYEIELNEAFPRTMSLVELNNSAQNQTHRLNITFAYRKWRRTDSKVNLEPKQSVPEVNLQINPIIIPKPEARKNVTYTGVYSPGTTSDDMSFGVGQLSG